MLIHTEAGRGMSYKHEICQYIRQKLLQRIVIGKTYYEYFNNQGLVCSGSFNLQENIDYSTKMSIGSSIKRYHARKDFPEFGVCMSLRRQ